MDSNVTTLTWQEADFVEAFFKDIGWYHEI